jgi:hypothetical protein
MNYSKKDVENAILQIAKMYGKEDSYKAIMASETGNLPKMVQMITYEMFLGQFDSRSCVDDIYCYYQILHEYAMELQTNGWVEFKK